MKIRAKLLDAGGTEIGYGIGKMTTSRSGIGQDESREGRHGQWWETTPFLDALRELE